jgi:hypothetical protein
MIWRPSAEPELRICGYTPLSADRAGGCVYGFWTDDFRFSSTWTKPLTMLDKILNAKLAAIVEPDHSTYEEDPLVEQLHAVYRTRWTGRFWQEHGLKVIPNVSWSDEASLEWSLLGIPFRPACIAIEGRPRQRRDGRWSHVVQEVCRRLEPQTVLLYGASAEEADRLPCRCLAFTAASPRTHIPARLS